MHRSLLTFSFQMNHEKLTDATGKSDEDSSANSATPRSSNVTNLLTRTTIREANNHLQMLYARNQELESIIEKQKEELHRKDFELNQLSKASQLLERHCQQLQTLLDDRTRRLHIYERKEGLFREALELKPAVESLLDVLSTFERVDQGSTITTNHKPLQFVQSPSKKKNNDVVQRPDAV